MAKNESNKPDDVKTTPENEQAAPVAKPYNFYRQLCDDGSLSAKSAVGESVAFSTVKGITRDI